MEEPTSSSSSRRGLLGRGLVMALGAVGLGAARRPDSGRRRHACDGPVDVDAPSLRTTAAPARAVTRARPGPGEGRPAHGLRAAAEPAERTGPRPLHGRTSRAQLAVRPRGEPRDPHVPPGRGHDPRPRRGGQRSRGPLRRPRRHWTLRGRLGQLPRPAEPTGAGRQRHSRVQPDTRAIGGREWRSMRF